MNSKVIVLITILVVIAGYFFYQKNASQNSITSDIPSPQVTTSEPASSKEFTVMGNDFSFTPSQLTVRKGDIVKINFKNTGGFHDLKIDELNVATKQIKGGEQETVVFTADESGSFEYYCSVGKHRAMGMKGILTVTE